MIRKFTRFDKYVPLIFGKLRTRGGITVIKAPQFRGDGYASPDWRLSFIRRDVRWTGMPAFTRLSDDGTWRLATMLTEKTGKQGGREAP